MDNSLKSKIFEGLRWETFPSQRVAVWDDAKQPSVDFLFTQLSAESATHSLSLRHDQRKKEFLASRLLSLYLTGEEPRQSGIGIPTWSNGWFGSISHKSGHVALWVNKEPNLTCGIDLERCRDFDLGLSQKIMSQEEMQIAMGGILSYAESLVFAAKEAIYKALSPLVGRLFYFEAVMLSAVSGSHAEYLLEFVVKEPLAPRLSIGARVLVRVKPLVLSDGTYWLALAFFPYFRQNQDPRG